MVRPTPRWRTSDSLFEFFLVGEGWTRASWHLAGTVKSLDGSGRLGGEHLRHGLRI